MQLASLYLPLKSSIKEIKNMKNQKRKSKQKNGRPFAITKEKEEILINMLSDGMSQAKAAQYIGVNEKTVMDHKKRFSEFTERIERAKLETHKLAHKSIRVGMLKDWRAGAWWLERTEPERFQEKKIVDTGYHPILIDDIFGSG